MAGREANWTGSSEALRHPRWAQATLRGAMGRARQVARVAGEVSSFCWGGHWSGQVPEPARARPCLAREPQPVVPGRLCPFHGHRGPCPSRQQGQFCWALSSLCLEGPALVSPSRIPQGLEGSWQIAWDLWKGQGSAQSLSLEFWTWLEGRPAHWPAPGGSAASTWKGPWNRRVICGPGLGADFYQELGCLGN